MTAIGSITGVDDIENITLLPSFTRIPNIHLSVTLLILQPL
jgi:hypothetical protein